MEIIICPSLYEHPDYPLQFTYMPGAEKGKVYENLTKKLSLILSPPPSPPLRK
jgi:hypothetical protein